MLTSSFFALHARAEEGEPALPTRASTSAYITNANPLTVPWKIGERLHFNIRVGILSAGEALLAIEESGRIAVSSNPVRMVDAYHFVATARSTPFVDVFYKVRDRNDSWMDTRQWIAHRFEQHNMEGKFILDQLVEFDWFNMHFKNQENVKGRAPKSEEGPLAVPALDTLSCLYAARAMIKDVGQDFTLDVHSGRNWPLLVKVVRKETVKVPAGKFECFMVEPVLRERGIFIQKGKKMYVWITADERRLPVKMAAEIFIGQVSAELTRIE